MSPYAASGPPQPPRRPPAVEVVASLGLYQLKQALRDATINNESFNVGWWSIWDAECLEAAAALIRREIAGRERARDEGHGPCD